MCRNLQFTFFKGKKIGIISKYFVCSMFCQDALEICLLQNSMLNSAEDQQ